jgi:hypothetical protein
MNVLDEARRKAYEERMEYEERQRHDGFGTSWARPFEDVSNAHGEMLCQEHRLEKIKVAVSQCATMQTMRHGPMVNQMQMNLSLYVLGLTAKDTETTKRVPVEMVYQPPTPTPSWFEEHMPTFFRWFGGQTQAVKPPAVVIKGTATFQVDIDAKKMFPTFMTREINDRDASYQYSAGVRFVSCVPT